MAEMKTLNGYEVVDAKARQDIALMKQSYYTKEEVIELIESYHKEPSYSVDLSQIQYDENSTSMGAWRSYAIINGTKVLFNMSSDTHNVYTDVKSLVLGINSDSAANSIVYTMGGTTYTFQLTNPPGEGTYYVNEEYTVNLTGDVVITAINEKGCLTADTLITMADGTYKRIDEVEVGDKVKALDPETNAIIEDTVIDSTSDSNKTETSYDKYTFSDGTIIKTVRRHRFYNIEKQAMTYMDEWNIGEHAYNESGNAVELISHERINEEVRYYTIFTNKNTYFANGLLSGNRRTAKITLH